MLTLSQDSQKSFYINAFGNPDDGYSFQGSTVVTNISNFQSINIVNQQLDNEFCLKAILSPNSTVLMLQSTVCYEQFGALCVKGPNNLPNCNSTSLKQKSIFDINGVTSLQDGEKSLLKSCFWKGIKIPCAAIFNTFPSDQGMCCSFNMKAADEIFEQATYSKLVMSKQTSDKKSSFMDFNLPRWYVVNGEPKTQPGINKGLTIMLDGHNDIISPGSIDSDFQGLTAIVTNRDSYPLTRQHGFQIKAGHFNLIGLSATKISAGPDTLAIDSRKRNCLFPQENKNMKIHKNYSLANCLLECSFFYAQDLLSKAMNLSQPCSPWYFPIYEEVGTICDPWEAAEFNRYFNNLPGNQCSHCLPDCDTVIYTPTITTIPFRRCDFRNLGVSSLCNLEDPFLPHPQIWAQDLLQQLSEENISNQALVQKFRLTSAERHFQTDELSHSTFNPANETYDAYEKDIAIVQFYFMKSSVIEFETSPSQNWIDFFSAIGGLLGLCIGISIITFVELFWLCFRILRKLFRMK